MLDYLTIIARHCTDDSLRHILLTHSRQVAEMALAVCHRHPELHADADFVYEAAMLHDIGIVRCNAPAIHCHGTLPYICHGLSGADILTAERLPRHARVAMRHTGTGITPEAIEEQRLPLPNGDYSPETIEEQIICYADKFYSKTHLERTRTPEQVLASLAKFGEQSQQRFLHWHHIFEV